MYFGNVLNETEDHDEQKQIIEVQISVAVFSFLLGLTSTISNFLLLLTLYKDPLKCFQRRATTVLIQCLAASDFLAGIFVQPVYAASLLFDVAGHEVQILYDIALIGSHVGTKISILTLIGLAVDRLFAITLPWKYNTILTRKRAALTSIFIWLFVGTFEVTHLNPSLEEVLQALDLHLQTTIPMVGLLVTSIATYLAFRKYSRNAVFSQSENNRIYVRNLRLEKKIIVMILFIMIVVLVSLTPYLIVQKISAVCSDHNHHHHQQGQDEEKSHCKESKGIVIAKVFSVCLLSLSCALNPILYAWRMPHYRQSLKMVVNTQTRRPGELVRDVPIPSVLRLTDGNSNNEP